MQFFRANFRASALRNIIIATFSASLLYACGGSSSDSSSPTPPTPPTSPPPPADAAIDVRTATLNGAQEEPAVLNTAATGQGAVVVDRTTHEITGGITFSGLTPVDAGVYMGAAGANGTDAIIALTLQGTDTAIIPPG